NPAGDGTNKARNPHDKPRDPNEKEKPDQGVANDRRFRHKTVDLADSFFAHDLKQGKDYESH
ncbi:unnamed protein product, partial [marine sediment metagenome]